MASAAGCSFVDLWVHRAGDDNPHKYFDAAIIPLVLSAFQQYAGLRSVLVGGPISASIFLLFFFFVKRGSRQPHAQSDSATQRPVLRFVGAVYFCNKRK